MSNNQRRSQCHGYFLVASVLVLNLANLTVGKAAEVGMPFPDPEAAFGGRSIGGGGCGCN